MTRALHAMTVVQRGVAALCAMALLSLAACSDAPDASGTRAPSGLDLVPLTITQGTTVHRFTVEVARTEAEQARGLMERTDLPADRGMIFPFTQPKFAAFWMRNTLIPLDMIFVRTDGSIDRIAENTVPGSEEPVASGDLVAAVLELRGGTSARLGIDETARVVWGAAAASENQP